MYNKFNKKNFEKIKIIYHKEGLTGILNLFFYFLGINFRLLNHEDKKINFFSRYFAHKFQNTIMYGPFKGVKLNYNISKSSLGAKLLGLYEQEVVDVICNYQKQKKKTQNTNLKYFIQLGSSDGFYVCSLIKKNIFEQAIIFENDEMSLNYLKKNLKENNISDERVKFFGLAKKNFINNILELKIKLNECFFLVDIEGDEYEILGEENLNKLNSSPLIVEMHEFYRKPHQMKQFNDFVEKNRNKFNKIFISNRNLPNINFLNDIISSEIDKNLLISELRPYGMYWYTYNIENEKKV